MTLKDFVSTLYNSDRIRILKDDAEIYVGYLASFAMGHGLEKNGELFTQYKNEEVKKFRAVPEITHKKWKELNLMRPLEPEETPDFSFSDLQLKIYYTIYI